MTPPPPLFHALLRPAVLQILRATGYHGAKTSVIDSVTDLAARYFLHLCQLTARYATHNGNNHDDLSLDLGLGLVPESEHPAAPTIVDVRMALQRAGALLPERSQVEQEYYLGLGREGKGEGEGEEEDMRGVEAFLKWAMGPVNREIKRIALDGDDEAGDYLDALKKKHSKNDDDSKYLGTLLGRSIEHGDVLVEGGDCPSIFVWEERRRIAARKTPGPQTQMQTQGDVNGDGGDGEDSRPPSSGLSSLGGRSIADEMDLS
ncbi:Transcription initiation factor TFIID subunit 3 [Madurella fahalii]|uniref:Transcription initiation factor TFIID subunit 3 n=1 Tax=Madurella fahalii TaxID=1157608 RepID=A0ABQ0FZZ3_9PEZI